MNSETYRNILSTVAICIGAVLFVIAMGSLIFRILLALVGIAFIWYGLQIRNNAQLYYMTRSWLYRYRR